MALSLLAVTSRAEFAAVARCLSRHRDGLTHVEVCNSDELSRRLRHEHCPDVVLVDETSGSTRQLVACIANAWRRTRILVIGSGRLEDIVASARAGAQGYLCQCGGAETIARAIRAAVLPDAGFVVSDCLVCAHRARSQSHLTRREREIASLLSGGLSNGELARRLHISKETASWHTKNILHKLGLRSRLQLVLPIKVLDFEPTVNPPSRHDVGAESSRVFGSAVHQSPPLGGRQD